MLGNRRRIPLLLVPFFFGEVDKVGSGLQRCTKYHIPKVASSTVLFLLCLLLPIIRPRGCPSQKPREGRISVEHFIFFSSEITCAHDTVAQRGRVDSRPDSSYPTLAHTRDLVPASTG